MAFNGVQFVKEHGIVLASGKGPVVNVAETIAKEPIRGSWWAHPKGKLIFTVLNEIADSEDVLCFRLVDGKITFVHRRMWPALIRVSRLLEKGSLDSIRQEHTDTGAHKNVVVKYPRWVTPDLRKKAEKMTVADARALLPEALFSG